MGFSCDGWEDIANPIILGFSASRELKYLICFENDLCSFHVCLLLYPWHCSEVRFLFFFEDASNIFFCMNRVLMAATDVKIAGICTESRTASNGTSPGVQNPKKQQNNRQEM